MNPWLLWAVIPFLVILREVLRWRRVRHLDAELKRLRWREKFAEIRDEAVMLIANDQLRPDAVAAEILYCGPSVFVRRADDYDGFAHSVLIHLVAENMPSEDRFRRLGEELETSDPAVKKLIGDYYASMIMLAWERSLLVRLLILARIQKRKATATRRPPWIRRNPIWRELYDVRRIAYCSRELKSHGLAIAA